METGRVALIRYRAPDGRQCIGSGLLIDERRVLTAGHVADGSGHRVECDSGASSVAQVLRSGEPEIDLAVLTLRSPVADLARLECARVDRGRVHRVSGCTAVGFPRWRKDGDSRRSAQVDGLVPTAEGLESTADAGLRAGWLTLIGERIPGVPEIPAGTLIDTAPSPWGGMSGAVVVAGDLVIGVVRSHNLAAGGQSLTVTPVTAIDHLPAGLRQQFWDALGVPDPSRLPVLPRATEWDYNLSRISEYLSAARIRAEEHPYSLGSMRVPDLPSVYLRQKVSPQSSQSSDQPKAPISAASNPPSSDIHVTEQQRSILLARAADQTAAHIAETLQRHDVQDILKQYRSAILIGGPGTGKSSLLRYLFYESSVRSNDMRVQRFVPVLVQARDMPADAAFPEAVAHAVMNDIGRFLDSSDLSELFAVEPARGIPWLILLDGIDEILDHNNRKQLLAAIAHRWRDRRYRFLVTSRTLSPVEFFPLERLNAPVFEVQQFNEEELPNFAERWLVAMGAADAPRLASALVNQLAHDRLVQLACNPLIMTMICTIFVSRPDDALPQSRSDLYERFITLLMSKAVEQLDERARLRDRIGPYGRPSQDAVETLLDDKRDLMQQLASGSMGTQAAQRLVDQAEALTATFRPENVPSSVWRQILEEVLRQSGVVVEHGSDFSFIHQTIKEYLAGCALASNVSGRRDRWRLKLAAGREDSLALFTASIMHSNEFDIIGRAPRILSLRRLVHARFVAALSYEGLALSPKTVRLAHERLVNFAAALHRSCIPYIARGYIWDDYEDDCVLAAKSLMLLDKQRGLVALAHAAVDPSVGGFNMYDYNRSLGLDRHRGLVILARLASSSEMESSDRVAVARLVSDENRELGLETIEAIALDGDVEGVLRSEMGFEVMRLNPDRGVGVLASLVADPLMERYRVDCETQLAAVDPVKCAMAMAALIADTKAKFSDRFGTVDRLLLVDRPMALRMLSEVSAESRNGGLIRIRAALALHQHSPSAGTRALRELSKDEDGGGFYRVFCLEWAWRIYKNREFLTDLEALASESTLTTRWRVFAAEQLAVIDRDLGQVALRRVCDDTTAGLGWRLRTRLAVMVLSRKPARWS